MLNYREFSRAIMVDFLGIFSFMCVRVCSGHLSPEEGLVKVAGVDFPSGICQGALTPSF